MTQDRDYAPVKVGDTVTAHDRWQPGLSGLAVVLDTDTEMKARGDGEVGHGAALLRFPDGRESWFLSALIRVVEADEKGE